MFYICVFVDVRDHLRGCFERTECTGKCLKDLGFNFFQFADSF